jgi:tRNA(fMet)-specific endonuclease VapC
MRLALDTNRYSDLIRTDHEVESILGAAEQVFIPFVVLAELHYGYRNGDQRAQNEKRLATFLSQPGYEVLYPDSKTVSLFADLRLQLRRQGTPIPIHDIWVAALTLQHGLTLYARDKHFDHLAQLARI